LQFPLFGWYFQGEQGPDGLQTIHTGDIDQLNAVIAGQLKTIPPVIIDNRGNLQR
jgi:hypothetical protein